MMLVVRLTFAPLEIVMNETMNTQRKTKSHLTIRLGELKMSQGNTTSSSSCLMVHGLSLTTNGITIITGIQTTWRILSLQRVLLPEVIFMFTLMKTGNNWLVSGFGTLIKKYLTTGVVLTRLYQSFTNTQKIGKSFKFSNLISNKASVFLVFDQHQEVTDMAIHLTFS